MTKNIVFCADGTWNHPGETEDGLPADTNVYKFYRALVPSANLSRHYDDGVGSDGTLLEKLNGGAFGDGLFNKIKQGYAAIACDYQSGDRIYIFGFSRGAYTARSLAGMIATCGLPAPNKFSDQATLDAFNAYREHQNRQPLLDQLKVKYGNVDVKIAVVGVWDTVGALGIPDNLFENVDNQIYGFLDTALHPNVQAAYHALSIDERRNEFAPTLWDSSITSGQELVQIWFSGVHADVGGGYAETGLSDITLGWMMANAAKNDLLFDPYTFQKYTTLDPKNALDVIHDSWTPLWGFPTSRKIPPDSFIANSVSIRVENLQAYRPANLPNDYPNTLDSYHVADVIGDPVVNLS
jgi:uncharacterized protein (DUF2235 family)